MKTHLPRFFQYIRKKLNCVLRKFLQKFLTELSPTIRSASSVIYIEVMRFAHAPQKIIHQQSPEHAFNFDNVQIPGREPDWFKRGSKEAIYVRTLKPSLNRDGD